MNLEVNLIKHGSGAELQLIGNIDATNAPDVDKLLIDVIGRYDSLVLDMGKLEYVSSAGLRAFKHAYIELRKKGGTLTAKNVGKMVMEVLEVTGFTRLFKFV